MLDRSGNPGQARTVRFMGVVIYSGQARWRPFSGTKGSGRVPSESFAKLQNHNQSSQHMLVSVSSDIHMSCCLSNFLQMALQRKGAPRGGAQMQPDHQRRHQQHTGVGPQGLDQPVRPRVAGARHEPGRPESDVNPGIRSGQGWLAIRKATLFAGIVRQCIHLLTTARTTLKSCCRTNIQGTGKMLYSIQAGSSR